MSRPIFSRPRTRVYGCNYDKGESYYKPAIENLDRKYSGRPLFPEARTSLADEIAARRSDIGTRDLGGSRHGILGRGDLDLDFEPRAGRRSPLAALGGDSFFDDDEPVFDIRGQRTTRSRRLLGDEFAEDVAATTSRLRSRLQLASDSLSSGERLFESTRSSARSALEEAESAFKRRPRFEGEARDEEPRTPLARWTKLEDPLEEVTSAAASRAKRSKARLDDLEAEMEEMAEKQARREQRTARLRALVKDTSCDDEYNLTSTEKRIAEKSEKYANM